MNIVAIHNQQITICNAQREDLPEDAVYVSTAEELNGSSLSVAELTELWNRLSGKTPIKRFKTRALAVETLWVRFEDMILPSLAETTPNSEMETLPSPSTSGKQQLVIDMLQQPEGVGITQIMDVTGWQKHSVRGFISGTVKKKLGHTVLSERSETGERTYRIVSA